MRVPLPTRVAIVEDAQAARGLGRALVLSRFWERLERARRAARVPPRRCRILIKPDLTLYDEHSPTGTDPALVEELIRRLHRRGFLRVAVGAARDGSGTWLENRDPAIVAELAGYRFRTAEGRPYDVLDLSEDLVEGPFIPGSVLAGSRIGRAWRQAHFRISFAAVKTDAGHGFILGAEALCDILPLRDKDLHYRHRLQLPDVCVALLAAVPPHFALLDAVCCGHGQLGSQHPLPYQADTIIASDSLLLADWAAARKMGLEPGASPVNAAALETLPLPEHYRVAGSLERWAGWINVDPLLTTSTQARDRSLAARRAFTPWLTTTNQELFPFRDPVDQRVNAALAWIRAHIETPTVRWGLVALNATIAQSHRTAVAARTLAAKDRLARVSLPLGLDLERIRPRDFEAVTEYIAPLARRLRAIPLGDEGFRKVKLEDSILFEFTRDIPSPYREFVSRVDITQAVSFMNDYIGGARVAVSRDRAGRIVHQAERNLYLPQPNYLVLSGGEPIDVAKLEVIRYGPREQRIDWRTLKSENGSATFDDGRVSFRQEGMGTRVTVLGRQQFALPPLWRAIRIDLWAPLYDALVDHAYRSFFSQTMANFEAAFEGREFHIGAPVDPASGEDDAPDLLPAARLGALARRSGEAAQRLGLDVPAVIEALVNGRAGPPGTLDDQGFRHGSAADLSAANGKSASVMRALRGFLRAAAEAGSQFAREYTEALQGDLERGGSRP
jgi:uncharacterized protein (DUF362 family)